MAPPPRKNVENGEFLWLMSLSDLMILLFILFVVLFSFTYKKVKQADIAKIMAGISNQKPPVNPIDTIHQELKKWVESAKLSDQIEIKKTDDAVIVEIKDKVVFPSAEFELHDAGKRAMVSLAATLEQVPPPYKLGIEGHTDDIPIHNDEVEDNWDLSAKRALNVLYALGLSDALLNRTVVMAYADRSPIVPNRTKEGQPLPENQARNRRVTVRIF